MRSFPFLSMALTVALTGTAVADSVPNVGPPADVAAVRAAEHQKRPTFGMGGVHVSGNYALVQWYGNPEGSGPAAFKRISGEHWTQVMFGGGAVTVGILAQSGIPASVAQRLCSGWPKGYSPCVGFN